MPDQIDPNDKFSKLWQYYMSVLRQLVIVRQRRPPRTFLAAFNTFFEESFRELGEEAFTENLGLAWSEFEGDELNRTTARLLRLEIAAFVNGYQSVTRDPLSADSDPPATKRWLSRDATAKDMTNAGKTILESILDALGDLMPAWVRGVLKILKEVLDIAGG